MTLNEIRNIAFGKYLLSFDSPLDAANHVLECLRSGSRDSMAWDLMEAAHGEDWRFPAEDIPAACLDAVLFLAMEKS